MNDKSPTTESVRQVLGLNAPAHRSRFLKRFSWVAVAGLAGAALWLSGRDAPDAKWQYTTQEISRGNFSVTVTATGNLEPTNKVDVGTEVSGTITELNADFNDHVKAGQVLAKLDTSRLEAQLTASRAALESARAKLQQAQATREESSSELQRLEKVHRLSAGRMPSASDLDTARASLKRAGADEAAARAAVAQAEAALAQDKTYLEKARVISPINGIVLNRSVELGQTIAANFQTPVLFTLAEDLAKMELHVDVDEADVGKVKAGQLARFSVDAYPERHFPATISQVRYGSQEVDGVITYKTLLDVDNADLSLRPGMTATAEITVQSVENALLVPLAALRFSPPEAPQVQPASQGNLLSRLMPRPPRMEARKPEVAKGGSKRIWILENGALRELEITIGADNGQVAEVTAGALDVGMQVVTDSTSVNK